MPHPDVEHMLKLVKEKTGYAVSVISDPGLTTYSAMFSASKDLPGQIHQDSVAGVHLCRIPGHTMDGLRRGLKQGVCGGA